MSFVDDTLSSVFGCEKEISRENAKDLEHFLKFTMILERHLNDPLSILCQMRRVFASYLEKHYSDPVQTSLRMADLTDSVRQFLVLFR